MSQDHLTRLRYLPEGKRPRIAVQPEDRSVPQQRTGVMRKPPMTEPDPTEISRLRDPAVARICASRGIRRLALFGSRLKGTARPDSDVDLLVEFEPGRVPGLMALSAIEIDLGEVLGHKVDQIGRASCRERV